VAHDSPRGSPPRPVGEAAGVPTPPSQISGVRVLVVDDDLTVRRATTRVLERGGFHVLAAEDGAVALALAESTPPDLALVDYEMPTPGLDVVRQVKALYGAAVWVAVLTGHHADDMRGSCFIAGADDVMEKPISPVELRRRVEAAARSQQAYVEARLARERADRLLAYGAEAAAMLAHDLNNGLAVAVSNIEFVTSGDVALPDDEAQALRSTLGALRRMSGLVANFVDIARFEDAAVKPRVTDVVVDALLRDVIDVHANAPALAQRRIQWEVKCEPELVARFDPALVERVLHNLVGNASRYCATGGLISLSSAPAKEGGVELVVFNTGPAIPGELAEQLFSKYARGKQGRRGLGLYFCKLACEAHGGTIEHRATPAGPAFVIHLPAPE
jgi:signal transduction histidine kinase